MLNAANRNHHFNLLLQLFLYDQSYKNKTADYQIIKYRKTRQQNKHLRNRLNFALDFHVQGNFICKKSISLLL